MNLGWQLGRLLVNESTWSPGALRPRLATGLPLHRGSGLPGGNRPERAPPLPLLARCLRSYVQRSRIRAVHVRRALLLFAIVLGLAALVASVSRTPAERKGR